MAIGADAEESGHAEARRLEAGNPLWLVVFGVSSGEFVCFPRFSVPFRAIVAAKEPAVLPPRMREVESSALRITISPGRDKQPAQQNDAAHPHEKRRHPLE
jgi:hypothetical protein